MAKVELTIWDGVVTLMSEFLPTFTYWRKRLQMLTEHFGEAAQHRIIGLEAPTANDALRKAL